jgi:pimeloyl-ACP methyl ester carboxylesterase
MQPTVVLLHGAVLNGGMWAPIAADLSRDYTVLTPDLPGHGARAGEKFTLDAAISTVVELAKSVAPAPIVLGGDSLGGYVSLASASAIGDQLEGAVLAGCTANFRGPVILAYRAQIGLTRMLKPETLKAKLEQRIAREFPAAAPAILAGGLVPGVFADAVEELRKVDFRAVLASFRPPLVLLNGSRDWQHVLGEKGARAANPRAEIRGVRGVGHGVSLARPAEFAAALREFLAPTEHSPVHSVKRGRRIS